MSLKKIGEGLSYNAIFKTFKIFLGLIISILMVRSLGKVDYGLYIFITGIFAILTPFYYLGLDSALLRYIPEYRTKGEFGKAKALLVKTIKIKIITWFFLSSIVLLIWNYYYPNTFDLAILVVIATLIGSIGSSFGITLESFYKIKFINIVGGFASLLGTLLIAVVLFHAPSVKNVILVGMIPTLLTTIILGKRLKKMLDIPSEEIKNDISRIMKYSLSMMATSFFMYIMWQKSEVVFLGIFRTNADVAVYAVSYSLSQRLALLIQMSIGGLGLISMTDVYVKNPLKAKEGIKKLIKFLFLAIVPLAIYALMEAEIIILTLYGEEMYDAIIPFKILIFVMVVSALGNMLGIVYKLKEKTVFYTKIVGLSALINIILDLLLIPSYGLYGAILAVVITLLIYSSLIFFYAYKLMGNIFPVEDIIKGITSTIPMIIILSITDASNNVFYFAVSLLSFLTYLVMLKITKTISEEDKDLINKMNIPILKHVIKYI